LLAVTVALTQGCHSC